MVMMMMVGGNDDYDDDDDGGDDEPFNILHCESLRTPRPQAQAQGIEIIRNPKFSRAQDTCRNPCTM